MKTLTFTLHIPENCRTVSEKDLLRFLAKQVQLQIDQTHEDELFEFHRVSYNVSLSELPVD